MGKVVYVPGFKGRVGEAWLLEDALREKGNRLIYFNYDTSFKKHIKEIGEEFRDYVEENLDLSRGEKISFIGNSAGGLVVYYYIKLLGGEEITDKIVTLETPLKGTRLASFLRNRNGVANMRKNSPLLEELAGIKLNQDIRVKNVWCPLDIVVPGYYARGINPEVTYYPFHVYIQDQPRVINKILSF